MTIVQWLAGSSGQIFASACVITILVLMLLVSVRLYKSYRRNGTHRMLIAALPIVILQQAALVSLFFPELSSSPYLHLAYSVAGPLSFIIINFVFMKLYTQPSSRLKGLPFLLMGAGLLLAAFVQLLLAPDMLSRPVGERGFPVLAIDFYGLAVNFAILLNLRGIEQRSGYSASLIVYFVFQLAELADSYIFRGEVPMLVIFRHLLPVVYYALLFLLLFDWVLDRLMQTFQSSITDGLTSLYTRRHFNRKTEQLLRETKRIAIIFCDIDGFKKLNDTHGHHKADGILKLVADIIREETAGIGFAGRYGGEELLGAVALQSAKPEQVAEKIRYRVETESLVTVSIGISCSREGASVEELVRQADEAMYQSKISGKNKVTLHPSAQRSHSRSSGKKSKRDNAPA